MCIPSRAALALALLTTSRLALADAPPSEKTSDKIVQVVLRGADPVASQVRARLEKGVVAHVTLQFVAAPAEAGPSVTAGDVIDAYLTRARQRFAARDYQGCLDAIGEPRLLGDLLVEQRRDVAAELLVWRMTCRIGTGDRPRALADGRELAALGLDLPRNLDQVPPLVRTMFDQGHEQVRLAGPRHLEISAGDARGEVTLDGRTEIACTTPCAIEVPTGDHLVRVERPGAPLAWKMVTVEEARSTVDLGTAQAGEGDAGSLWREKYAGSPEITSAESLSLLSQALKAERVAVIALETRDGIVYLRGALAEKGRLRGEAQSSCKEADVDESAAAFAHELLGAAGVSEPPLYKRPILWIGVGAAALVVITATALAIWAAGR